MRTRSLPWLMAISLAVLIANKSLSAQQAPPAATPANPPPTGEDGRKVAEWLKKAFGDQPLTEAAEMLIAIARGSQMGPNDGWFKPGQSRYGWKWLAGRHGVEKGGVPRSQFRGPEALFDRLDRNKDGQLKADDFDWSDRTPYAMQAMMLGRVFRRINQAADGRLTKAEWDQFFAEASRGKDFLTTEDLREAMAPAFAGGGFSPADAPSPEVLVRGLFRGEIGSMMEGPKLDQPAPDFTLKTVDGKQTIRLGEQIGPRPVVLVFGNFTCGPFRAAYALVEQLAQRYKSEATFLGVYVREAHPTDGWHMGSNEDLGVTVPQPKDYRERIAVAGQCQLKLKISIPLLVDEMDDRVGHAYSGMPARLYLIDRQGKIAYKSGRGPFGFKPGELEQALVMLLLDQQDTGSTAGTTK